ncbi:MAG: PLP-dependent aminotransferase family protein [Clostridia bacterium]|nr:PLP-dependent aminotransferase family protein [Clostridia bacterium]
MKYKINRNEHSLAYLQLYIQIRNDIVAGVYPYGTKLPSKRLLAEEVEVSVITVEHAYSLLIDEGYIEARERSGYFVIFRTDDGFTLNSVSPAKELLSPRHEGSLEEFPFSVLAKTMRRVISEYGESILDRSDSTGTLKLREAIRRYLGRSRGIVAKSEQIIIGSGSEYLYSLAVELLGRKKMFALESPSYKKIEQVYSAADVKYELLPLCQDGIESIALKNTSADVLHISPYRSFPSGVTATASKRHEYIRWAEKKNRYIIEDDFESEFSVSKKTEETLFANSKSDNIIYMNSFSRTISPSLRVAYMVIPEHLSKRFKEKLGFHSCTVPTFIQYVLAELILSGDFERHINRVRRKLRKTRN